MKKSLRNLVALSLAAVMSLSLAACGGGDTKPSQSDAPVKTEGEKEPDKTEGEKEPEKTEDEGKREPVTITAFYESGEVPTDDNLLSALMKEDLGVTLDVEYLVGDLDERIGLMTAAGEYPDIMPFNQRVVDAGGARALDDIIVNYPNLDKHYSKYYGMMKSSADGKLYYMPNFGVIQGEEKITAHWGTGNFIQKAVLEWAGYPKITTMDQFFDVIEKYQAEFPEIDGAKTIGFTILIDGWRNFGLVNPPQFLAGYQNNGNCIVDAETEIASDPSTTDIAKRYYQKLNEINKKGLLDVEFTAMNYDQYIQKLSTGNVLACMDQKWSMNSANTALVGQGKYDRTYVSIPLVYEDSIKEHYRDQTIVNLNNGFMVTTTDDAKVDRIMQFLDDICTEKWTKLLSWGIEGDAYEVGEDGIFYRTPEQRTEQEDSSWNLKHKLNAFLNYCPKIEGTFSDGNAYGPGNDANEFYASLSEYDKSFLDGYGFKTWADFFNEPGPNPIWYPTWNITIPDDSPASVAMTKAGDVKVSVLPQVIMADDFEAAWADFVSQYNEANYDVAIDFINEQIQWRKDNWG